MGPLHVGAMAGFGAGALLEAISLDLIAGLSAPADSVIWTC